MRLVELYKRYNSYTDYLKKKGYDVPELDGKDGYALVIYTPSSSVRKYNDLSAAKKDIPSGNEHWQIYDLKTRKPVKEPDWWYGQEETQSLLVRSAVGS